MIRIRGCKSMARTFIFANGTMKQWPDRLCSLPEPDDLIIAADGGLHHCRRWNWTPHVLIGDMESVDPRLVEALDPAATTIIPHPTQKDETDLELALKLAISRNLGEIVILGALGGRWDMTLSNVLLLGATFLDGVNVLIYDGNDVIRCLKGGTDICLAGNPGDRLSILPISEKVSGLTLEGLVYPLLDATLSIGTSQGISNVFSRDTARIVLDKGMVLVTVTREKTSPD